MMMNSEAMSVEACYDEWSASYFDEYYGENAPYPPVHVNLIVDVLSAHGAQRVLDAGCGPASIVRMLVKRGFDCWGFDLSPGMVEEARVALREIGIPSEERIWQGDASQASSYHAPAEGEAFDAAMAIGVLPHMSPAQTHATFENLRNAVRPGGLVIVQARNALFSLFTMNRNTHDFVRDELMVVGDDDNQAFAEAALAQMSEHLQMDLPANRGGAGYDDTQPRAENPLTFSAKFAACGFRDVQTLFYHYHAAPPMCEGIDPKTFRTMSLAMENPKDWRGHFMASSFMLAGIRT